MDRDSLQQAKTLLKNIIEYYPTRVIAIVATQCDMPKEQWAVAVQEILDLGGTYEIKGGIHFASAKMDQGVEEVFKATAIAVMCSLQNRLAPRF